MPYVIDALGEKPFVLLEPLLLCGRDPGIPPFPLRLLLAEFRKLVRGRVQERLQLGGEGLIRGGKPLQPFA
jgi:hypothetical protein